MGAAGGLWGLQGGNGDVTCAGLAACLSLIPSSGLRRPVLCSEWSPSQPTVLLSVRTVPHSHDDAGFLLAWTCQLAAVALNEMDV